MNSVILLLRDLEWLAACSHALDLRSGAVRSAGLAARCIDAHTSRCHLSNATDLSTFSQGTVRGAKVHQAGYLGRVAHVRHHRLLSVAHWSVCRGDSSRTSSVKTMVGIRHSG